MSDHPKRTLPLAASITHLKREAKALRTAFDTGDADIRDRVTAHVEPLPARLAQAQALFVVAREYGFPSWPVLKRHVERRTRTVFADVEGVGPALADLLDDANASVADTLESAFDSDSEVLVLYLDARRSDRLPAARVAALRARKLVVTGSGANWLCRMLDLEIGGGMVSEVQPIEVVDNGVLKGHQLDPVIEPLLRPPSPDSFTLGRDPRHVEWRPVPDELRSGRGAGFVDVIARLEREAASAVAARQANCVFAGVMAHPDGWSTDYRELFRRLVTGLAERELEDFQLAVVPRQVHPPGTVEFHLDALFRRPSRGADAKGDRQFHFQFDRETVFTATLRHTGSNAAMLCFQGGPQQHCFTREDAEHGETLTIAVTLRQTVIDAMAGRYWVLDVSNFDTAHGMSAELTVRYDALEGGDIRPLPSNASFEHFHWFAERSGSGDPHARRSATARTFGFDDWKTLQGHVAWSEPWLPNDGAHVRDGNLLEALAKYDESFDIAEFVSPTPLGSGPRIRDSGLLEALRKHGESLGFAQLMEVISKQARVAVDLRGAVETAFAFAKADMHAWVDVEHLLLALLNEPVADDVLIKCGADTARLWSDLQAGLEWARKAPTTCISRELFGVLWRAGFYRVLGREGANAANVLVGTFAEPCLSRDLLQQQGVSRAGCDPLPGARNSEVVAESRSLGGCGVGTRRGGFTRGLCPCRAAAARGVRSRPRSAGASEQPRRIGATGVTCRAAPHTERTRRLRGEHANVVRWSASTDARSQSGDATGGGAVKTER
ncbi:MAG: hypothetical protein OXQ90_18170 [Gammaproteobacteria bacterium]|nr:hypothetical protein [Gammaproteobacteria bacterium]